MNVCGGLEMSWMAKRGNVLVGCRKPGLYKEQGQRLKEKNTLEKRETTMRYSEWNWKRERPGRTGNAAT